MDFVAAAAAGVVADFCSCRCCCSCKVSATFWRLQWNKHNKIVDECSIINMKIVLNSFSFRSPSSGVLVIFFLFFFRLIVSSYLS